MWEAYIHPEFCLQGLVKPTKHAWLEEAKRLQQTSEKEAVAIGVFLETWLDESDSISLTTSGSTGKPKPIALKKKHMQASAEATAAYFDLKAGTSALLCMPIDFVAGKMMLVRAMQMGWHLDWVKPSQNPLSGPEFYDFVAMTPYQVAHSLSDLHKVKCLLIGGGAVGPELHEKLQEVSSQAFASYGMTETCSHIALRAINGPASSLVYKATQHVKFTTDSRDCLVIDAPQVHEGVLVTNDIVILHSDTSFEWKGRFDSVINSGGIKIHPEMVEQKLAKLISSPFFIAGVADEVLENKVVLLIEADTLIEESILQKALALLDKYEQPKQIFYLPSFLWTPTGKIRREESLKLLYKSL